jgi:hypothetical protein
LEQIHTAFVTGQATVAPGDIPRHLKNAHAWRKGELVLIRKERKGSPRKIDAAMAATLAYEARNDALTAGLFVGLKRRSKVYGF